MGGCNGDGISALIANRVVQSLGKTSHACVLYNNPDEYRKNITWIPQKIDIILFTE